MRAIDSNVLLRLIVRDDASRTASAEVFVERGAWVSILALAETTWVLSSVYDRGAAELAAAIQMLLDHRELVLQDEDAVREALALFRKKPSRGFSDCLMLQLARKEGHVPLGTFNRSLARVEGTQKL